MQKNNAIRKFTEINFPTDRTDLQTMSNKMENLIYLNAKINHNLLHFSEYNVNPLKIVFDALLIFSDAWQEMKRKSTKWIEISFWKFRKRNFNQKVSILKLQNK